MHLVQKYFALLSTLLVPVLYCLIALIFYVVLYKWKAKKFQDKKIQQAAVNSLQLNREIKYTLISLSIFGAMGYCVYLVYEAGVSQIYFEAQRYSYIYFSVSIVLMIVLHDTYFYWTHRVLHVGWWYENIHIVHHLSSNPSPFTALVFHPLEAFIQAAFIPLAVIVIPIHPIALTVFVFYMTIKNVLGHCGYDLTGNILKRSKYNRWRNSAVNHNMHHLYARDNYGLYFTFWDRFMKTFRRDM